MRKRVLTTTLLGIVAMTALAGCSAMSTTTDDTSYDVSEPVTRLALTGDAASVQLKAGDGPVQVKETYKYSDNRPRTEHRVDGDTLYLTEKGCGGSGMMFRQCETGYEIQVPAGTVVEIRLDAGAVRVRDLAGDLTVETDAGRIEATGLRSGLVAAKSDAGAISLRFATPPSSASARTDAGKVEIYVPTGTKYAVEAATDAGDVDVSVDRDPASTHRITAQTDAGRVTVGNA